MAMIIPTGEIRQAGDSLIDISSRIAVLLARANSISSAINKCYMNGGVGNRPSEAIARMKREMDLSSRRGKVLCAAVNIYENKEQQLESQSRATAETIKNGYNVSWTQRSEIQFILTTGLNTIYTVSVPIGVLATIGVSYLLRNRKNTTVTQDFIESEELATEDNDVAKTLADEWLYFNKVSQINEKVPVGQKQETEQSGSGLCTYSATTTLLRRREAADGYEPSFQFSDVHRANGGNGTIGNDGRWPDSWFTFSRTYTTSDPHISYQMTYEEGHSSSERVVDLLRSHPEGIMVYSPSSGGYNHAIVITDYEISADGSIQFYADDPVNNNSSYYQSGRVPLDQTWLYTQNNKIVETAVRVAYLK